MKAISPLVCGFPTDDEEGSRKKEAELLGWVVLMITRTAIILSSRQFLSYEPLNQGEIKRDERNSDLFGVANVR